MHLGLCDKIVDGVKEDIACDGRPRQERGPRPAVILSIQDEVGDDDAHADSDHKQDREDEQYETVHIVELVVPKGGEDEVHLDEDAPEGQKPAQWDKYPTLQVPLLLGNLPRNLGDPAGRSEGLREVAADEGAGEDEGARNEDPNEHNHHHGAKRDGGERVVAHGHHVEQQHHQHAQAGEASCGEYHCLDPRRTLALLDIVRRRHVAAHEGRHGVDEQRRRRDRAAADVERARDGERRREVHHEDQLYARADHGAEERVVGRKPEHVPLHLLPPSLLGRVDGVLVVAHPAAHTGGRGAGGRERGRAKPR
mmetsp:Transcript_14346/g.39207  ORF Transcript_14346/g.39207 Transcript_14346/m.39207 type:complete len:309 (-) Transcript_14346:254-1180(-)